MVKVMQQMANLEEVGPKGPEGKWRVLRPRSITSLWCCWCLVVEELPGSMALLPRYDEAFTLQLFTVYTPR